MRRIVSCHFCCLVLLVGSTSCREHESPALPRDNAWSNPVAGDRVRLPVPHTKPIVRIRIRRVVGELEPVQFAHSGQEVVIQDEAGTTVTRQGPLTVRRDRTGWLVRATDTWKFPGSMQEAAWIALSAKGGLELSDDSGETRRYAGSVRCVQSPGKQGFTWDVIEHVDIESYLPGVLSGELFGHWGKQCQAAQAIAARSFVTMECKLRQGRRWDVVDTPGSQAYLGVVEDSRSHAACEMTEGMVLTWGAELVPGYFSSCCGGRAATAMEAIGPNPVNAVPPLKGHGGEGYCQDAPLFTWERECDGAALGAAIRAGAEKGSHARSIGTVARIVIVSRNRHGRGVKLRVTDTSGNRADLAAEDLLRYSRSLPGGPLYSGWVEGRRKRGRLQLSGHGYGHGVGLCQYGAAEMDRDGKSFWQMIEYYYPGAEIKKAW